MRKVVIAVLLLLNWKANAQNAEEWMQQKQTQIRYLAEQIAMLRTYAGYVEKGYGIIKYGLQVIDDIKQGEFSLHNDYFNSLRQVKPIIGMNWKVGAIMLSAQRTMAAYRRSTKALDGAATLYDAEQQYIVHTWNGLLHAVAGVISDLLLVTGAGTVSVSDNGRMHALDSLLEQIEFHEAFAVHLSLVANGFAENRRRELIENGAIKKIYGK